jgi:hypothetical protein
MPTFDPKYPKDCPPMNAQLANGVVFRGIKKTPISEKDFFSWVEKKIPQGDPTKCDHWGLSIWMSEADAFHAQNLFPSLFGKWHVAAGNVTGQDGKVALTPHNNYPQHHTFWKAKDVALAARFKIVLKPLAAE